MEIKNKLTLVIVALVTLTLCILLDFSARTLQATYEFGYINSSEDIMRNMNLASDSCTTVVANDIHFVATHCLTESVNV